MTKKGRGSTFSTVELDILLSIVEDRLPLGQEAWERVGDEAWSETTNSTVARDNESLRKKLKALQYTNKPTGVSLRKRRHMPKRKKRES